MGSIPDLTAVVLFCERFYVAVKFYIQPTEIAHCADRKLIEIIGSSVFHPSLKTLLSGPPFTGGRFHISNRRKDRILHSYRIDHRRDILQKGYTLIVWRLDRLGRSLVNLVEHVSVLGKQGVEFRSLTESIDTGSSGGKLLFHMIAALAEFERSLISERTKAGMAAAKLRGKHVGRPRRSQVTIAANAKRN